MRGNMISKYSVKRPYTIVVAIVMAILLGVVSFTSMTVDLLPNITLPYAMIITSYPGANPEMVESVVTKPIEQSMATVSNIASISSTSSENSSTVMLEFSQTANMDSATLEIREMLDQIKGFWPDEIGNPMIIKMNPNMMPIMSLGIGAKDKDIAETTLWVENEIVPTIESIEGVASVNTVGMVERTVEVTLEDAKIQAVNRQVKDALSGTFDEAQDELNNAKNELTSGEDKLNQGAQELANQKTQLAQAQAEISKQEEALKTAYDQAISMAYIQVEEAFEEGKNQMIQTQINGVKDQIQSLMDQIKEWEDSLKTPEGETPEMELPEGELPQIEAREVSADSIQALIENARKELETKIKELASLQKQEDEMLKAAKEQAKKAIDAQFQPGFDGIAQGKQQLAEGASALDAASIQATIEIATAKASLAMGKTQIEDGEKKLEESKESALEGADMNQMISAEMINGILTAQNFSMPAGYVEEDNIKYLVRVGDKFADIQDIENVPLFDMGIKGLDTIVLKDVAKVAYTSNQDDVYARINGEEGVMLTLQKQTGYSTGDVSKRINEKLAEIEKENADATIGILMDQGVYIDVIVDSVLQNMIYGAILAVIILLIFLRSIRPTLVIAFSIPISIVIALVLMYFSGISLNIISLSGLALGIGMLVDNSIVVIENIYRMRNEEGASVKEAAIQGAQQVSGAIAASTLTTVCVFLPIVFVEGITRQLFVDMGLTIAYSLLASLVVALTVVPVMLSGLLKKDQLKESIFFHKIQNVYGKFLAVALRFKVLVLLGAFVLLIGSAILAAGNGTAFLPTMESTQIMLTLETEKGTEFSTTAKEADKFMEGALEIPDIKDIGGMMSSGDMMGMGGSSSNTTSVQIYAILEDKRTMSNDEIEKALEEQGKNVNADVQISMSSMDMSALGGSGIIVEVKGKELDKLQEVSKEIADIIGTVDGTENVLNGMEDANEELRVIVDKEKAAEKGLTVAQVFQEINKKLAETKAISTLQTDVADFGIQVMDEKQESLSRESIKKLTFTVEQKDGKKEEVKLSDIASFEKASSLQAIQRDAQTRVMSVTAGIEKDHNIGLVAADVKKALEKYEAPEGYSFKMAGEDENIMEALLQLVKMLGLAVVFMYLIMVAQFQSLRSPFIIMFTVPLAFTGGLLGLWITGKEISTIAMIGFVMLSGIIVNNGIVLVDYTNQLILSGMEKREALITAGKTRLRSIIMTAATTVLGLSTMAIGLGMGADMTQPMAIVTIGGLLYGTILTLVVVPCIYDLFHKKGRKAKRKNKTQDVEDLQEVLDVES